MNYLYHMIPLNMQGNTLYPLNDLRDIYPKIYKEHKKKYQGREHLLKVEIPSLNCLWNDVLHLTAVNPINVMNTLIESGSTYNFKELHWYKINPNYLDKENALIFLYKDRIDERKRRHDLDNFTDYNIPYLSKISKLPQSTINYYKKEIGEGRKPLFFHLVPHILYRGSINIKNCEVIKL